MPYRPREEIESAFWGHSEDGGEIQEANAQLLILEVLLDIRDQLLLDDDFGG